MENRKDIGKAISNKLNSLEKTPTENVWNGISYELQKKKKRRMGFFFFWTKTIGLILVGAIAALYIYNQNVDFNTLSPKDSNEPIIVNDNNRETNTNNSNDRNAKNENINSNLNNRNIVEDENNIHTVGNKNNPKNSNSAKGKSKKGSMKDPRNSHSVSKNSNSSKQKSDQFSNVKSKKPIKRVKSKTVQENQNESNGEQNTTVLFDPTSLQNKSSADQTQEISLKKTDSLVAQKDKEKTKNINMYPEDKKKIDSAKKYRKFDIDAFVSPTIYGHFAKKSTLDRRLDGISKSSTITMSYGFGLTYEIGEKLSIRMGYSKIALESTTKNVAVNTQNYAGIKYNPTVTNQTIYDASNNAEKMDITQEISYTEIPLELRYKFMDKKIGLYAIAGFSYLILDKNSVSIKTNNGYSQQIGKMNNIMDTSASTNIGFGVDCQIFKNTKIFAEPMFNYQIMSFENSNPKPYFFEIHTGIRYTFLNK